MIGIDFGTSTLEIAVAHGEHTRLLADAAGEKIVPSVIAYPPGRSPLVGTAAAIRWRMDPENTIHSIKRIMGRRWYDQEVVDYREVSGVALEQGPGHQPLISCRGGQLTPQAIVTTLLELSRKELNCPSTGAATICVPPSFNVEARLQLSEAAREAGFERVMTIDEPYAAALPTLVAGTETKTIFVFDLGGGTLDVAILQVAGLSHQVLASAGDPALGGDDLDLALAEIVRDRILMERQWDLRARPESWRALIGVCKQAKTRLSQLPKTQVALGLVDPVVAEVQLTLTHADLEAGLHELLQRSFAICDLALSQAGLRTQDIDEVILSGGSTYLPAVQEHVGRYFQRPCGIPFPPDQLVARGAAIAARHRS